MEDLQGVLSVMTVLLTGSKCSPVSIFALPFCQEFIFSFSPTSSLDRSLIYIGRHRHGNFDLQSADCFELTLRLLERHCATERQKYLDDCTESVSVAEG